MYEYSDSIKCAFCGQRLIVTNVEIEHHVNNCKKLREAPCGFLRKKILGPIREYDKNRSTGIVLCAIEEAGGLPAASVLVTDSYTTFGDLLESTSFKTFLANSRAETRGKAAGFHFTAVDVDMPGESTAAILSDTLMDVFANIRMLRLVGVRGQEDYRVTIKKVMVFDRSVQTPHEPILLAQGIAPFNDFFCLGFLMDRFCNEEETMKNANMLQYANSLFRRVEPAVMFDNPEVSQEYDSLLINYIPQMLAKKFFDDMEKNTDCFRVSVEQQFNKKTDSVLKSIVESYTSAKGMKKPDKVKFLSSGRHVEIALREHINPYEYRCLCDLMNKGGKEYVSQECECAYFNLYDMGLLFPGTDSDGRSLVYIPREFIFIFKSILSDREVIASMDNMSMVDGRINGLLYNYGALTTRKLYKMYVTLFGNAFDPGDDAFDELLFLKYVLDKYTKWSNRDSVGDVFLGEEEIIIFHERMEYPGELYGYKQPRPMRQPVRSEVEVAGDREYIEYNETFDRLALDILARIENRDEYAAQTLNYYIYTIMLYEAKQGFPADEIFENLVRYLPVPADEMMFVYTALSRELPKISRWDIGGYSTEEIKQIRKAKAKVQKLTMR